MDNAYNEINLFFVSQLMFVVIIVIHFSYHVPGHVLLLPRDS